MKPKKPSPTEAGMGSYHVAYVSDSGTTGRLVAYLTSEGGGYDWTSIKGRALTYREDEAEFALARANRLLRRVRLGELVSLSFSKGAGR